MKSLPEDLLEKHPGIVHSEGKTVLSHTQREEGDWYINTLMLIDCETPFKYRRTKRYKTLKGQKINVTYYPDNESIAGFDMEIMRVVRLRRC